MYPDLKNDTEQDMRIHFGRQLEEFSYCFDMDELEQKINAITEKRNNK